MEEQIAFEPGPGVGVGSRSLSASFAFSESHQAAKTRLSPSWSLHFQKLLYFLFIKLFIFVKKLIN